MDIQEKKSFCVVLGHRIQNVLLQVCALFFCWVPLLNVVVSPSLILIPWSAVWVSQRLDPELHQHLSSLNIHPFHYVLYASPIPAFLVVSSAPFL